jgi:hypothetical protein
LYEDKPPNQVACLIERPGWAMVWSAYVDNLLVKTLPAQNNNPSTYKASIHFSKPAQLH